MAEILDIVLPVFLVIGLGRVLGASGMLNPTVNAHLTRLVFYVAAPALLLRSVARTPLGEAVQLDAIGATAGVTVGMVLVLYLAGLRMPPSRRGVFVQGAHRSNMVFVGLPVIVNACGEGVLGPAAVFIGFMVVVYNFLAVIVLVLPHRASDESAWGAWSKAGVKILGNPLILASGGGLVLSGFEIGLPVVADRSLELVGRIAMPLALLSVGASLDLRRLRTEVGATALVSLLKLVVYPGLVCGGLVLLGVTGDALLYPVLIMASPTAVVSFIMAQEMKGDENLAAAIVIGTTIASLLTISGWLALLPYLA